MNREENKEIDFIDLLSILSFWLSVINVKQNIGQTKAEASNRANEIKRNLIIEKIEREFETQNKILYSLEKKVDEILEGGKQYGL